MRGAAVPCLLLGFAFAQESPPATPPTPAPSPAPAPRLVTAQTRADRATLTRLEQPGTVLFADDFESDASFARWFEANGREQGRTRIATETDVAHGGRGALALTSTANDGKSQGAGLVAWLGDEGHDCVHLRYWIRYAPDYDQGNLHHTGGSISAVAGTDKWAGMGSAGKLPRGDDHFDSRVEGWCDWRRVPPPGFLHCYTYWMDMRRDRDGNYWGNMLGPEPGERHVPERGAWHCIEHRIAANAPGAPDGEMAVWIDGKLYLHYTGIRWRSSAEVRIKRIGLLVYVHEARADNTAWFDDVVVSTGYVGPAGSPVPATKARGQ